MREILFRGKRTDNGEWVYGVPIKDQQGEMVIVESIFECEEYDCRGANCWYVDEKTIGQYTGLKDNNGNKIFEGDVVKDEFEEIGVVEFNTEDVASCGCCYEFFTGTGFRAENICLHSCEIIGNIHDNKLEDFENGC